jgi:protein phosphatase
MQSLNASPWDALNEYIYPDRSLERFKELRHSWVFIGHTHYSMDRIAGAARVINPGSLGQPRDGNWPRFAVVDLAGGNVDFKEVRFDSKIFMRQVRQRAPADEYLCKVIERIS